MQLGGVPNAPWVELNRRRHAHDEGFDLHADVAIAASDRQGLEQVLRYGARPAVAGEPLRFTADGRVALELKRRYHDGTTHFVFEPLAFVERLAALIPKPHKNLVIYSGVLAPNAKLRRKVVAYGATRNLATSGAGEGTEPREATVACEAATPAGERRRPNYAWADLMRRAFGVDVLRCPHCGDRLKLLAAVVSPPAIRAILNVDTGAWFAHLVAEDADHAAAGRLFKQARAERWWLVTTNAVMFETHALLVNRAREGRILALGFLDDLEVRRFASSSA